MRSTSTERFLVIGYGNPMRGDDGAGWEVVRKLRELIDADRATALSVHQLTPELAEPISRADRVIFIDAADRVPVGRISVRRVEPEDVRRTMTHQASPQALMAMSQVVFGRRPAALLITVGGERFGHSEGLSDSVRHACDGVVRIVTGQIDARVVDRNIALRAGAEARA